MPGIVPSEPQIIDPSDAKKKRKVAGRLIISGAFFLIIGLLVFLCSNEEWAMLTVSSLLFGLVGVGFSVIGLVKLPKVRYTPPNIMR